MSTALGAALSLALFLASASVVDAFGWGWNLFGTAEFSSSLIVGARTVWFTELGLVVLAHIGGVWMAHRIAIRRYRHTTVGATSQYPLMLLMVGFTVFTLWLLSQPLVAKEG